ncbi:cocaine- and amphetamine-regulated transcript protein-like [Gopherus evgoodei]|uniref:cocaine- and amphetamine-regulated transcript protein-like n=1 Tax=Gopherus evgoodei TaxID=1825980 RepID=UPI0011D00148|nr:cocaine- and amphetamine-regulated transcript protein-like [Gopherus evgoodei]
MQRATMLLLCLALLAHQEADGDAQLPQDFPLKHSYQPHEKQLLEELQDVLEKLQSKRISTWKKKYNQVPKCFIGQACAVKKGARIGRLCDCPRGATCNSFLLRCL